MKKFYLFLMTTAFAVVLLGAQHAGRRTTDTPPPQATVLSSRPLSEEKTHPTTPTNHTTRPRQAVIVRVPGAPAAKLSPIDDAIIVDGKRYPRRRYKATLTPNDITPTQWWTSKTNLEAAWDIPTGSHQTLLAIIDTGIALQHEEFANRWHQNSGEVGAATSEAASTKNCTDLGLALDKSCNLIDDNHDSIVDNESGTTTEENPSLLNCTDQSIPVNKSCNRIDDDGNSMIDDVTGWDFVDNHPSAQAGKTNPDGGTDTQHATMVAGIAAASGNNGVGLAGVDWNAKILPIQALSDNGYGDTLTVSNAVYYAVDQGAEVINLSLGSAAPDPYLLQAVEYAIEHNVVIVAAAGNDGCNCMLYPANYAPVVAVGASDENDIPTSFSSYGSNLDILAPGVNLYTATWYLGDEINAYASGATGTSFATPFVAGLIARAKTYLPTATPEQLIGIVTQTTNRLTLNTTASRSNTIGFGRADALAAMTRASTADAPAQRNYFNNVVGSPIAGGGTSTAASVYVCENSRPGSTPIYRLSKSGQVTSYTLSDVTNGQKVATGYTSRLVAYACIDTPSDAPVATRSLSIPVELENRSAKD